MRQRFDFEPHDIDPDEVVELINTFKYQRDNLTPESYSIIRNTLGLIEHTGLPAFRVPEGLYLYRFRKNEDPNAFYESIDDLSFRRDLHNIKTFGRANEPIQSIFYCSDIQETAFGESSTITRKEEDIDEETLTMGVWQVTSEFVMAHIIVRDYNNGMHLRNEIVKNLLNGVKQMQQEHKIDDKDLDLYAFFMEEFAARGFEDKYYLTTSAFANRIYDFPGDIELGGIIYPSAIYNERGINFAIKPEIVEKHLKLVYARRSVSKRISEDEYQEQNIIETTNIDHSTGRIVWR